MKIEFHFGKGRIVRINFLERKWSRSVLSDSLWPHGLVAYQAPLSMGFSSKNTGVGCHFLLQGIFLPQGSNPCLLHLLLCRWILYHWATREAQEIDMHWLDLLQPVSYWPFEINYCWEDGLWLGERQSNLPQPPRFCGQGDFPAQHMCRGKVSSCPLVTLSTL